MLINAINTNTMSLKALTKTRWKIEPDRVTVYPYGTFYILAAVLAILFSGILFLYMKYQNTTVTESLPLVFFLLILVVLFWSFAATYVEFDNARGQARKMVMGFLPTATISFAKLQGIDAVSNMAGSYNYRLFQRDDRYGKGIVVSTGYTKNDDPNAIAFVSEAVPVIHGFLDQHGSPTGDVTEPITVYKFFDEKHGKYSIKNKKAGAIIFSLFFFGLGVWLFNAPANSAIMMAMMTLLMFFLGFVFINAAFTTITFDPANQMIRRTGLLKFLNREYHFGAFAGVQTVRHTVNLIYTRTSVNMYFEVPSKKKQDVITVASLRRSKNIDRFVRELYAIMEIH
jgi:hypothetical protein